MTGEAMRARSAFLPALVLVAAGGFAAQANAVDWTGSKPPAAAGSPRQFLQATSSRDQEAFQTTGAKRSQWIWYRKAPGRWWGSRRITIRDWDHLRTDGFHTVAQEVITPKRFGLGSKRQIFVRDGNQIRELETRWGKVYVPSTKPGGGGTIPLHVLRRRLLRDSIHEILTNPRASEPW